MGDKVMKAIIFTVCLLCSAAAFAQAGSAGISARPQPVTFDYNAQHAARQPMAEPQNLTDSSASTYTYGQGERPLWEVAVETHEVPLGDSARALRKEHEVVKKSAKVWNN